MASQALRLAEADALDKASRAITELISSATDFSLLEHPVIAVKAEKVSSDSSGEFGKVKQVKLPEGAGFEAKVRLQVKPAALNPYRLAAQVRRDELKVARLDLLRQFPSLKDSALSWDSKLIALKPNGETGAVIALTSFGGLTAEGQLHISKQIVERDYADIGGGLFQLQLVVNLPEGINGDEAKLEIVLKGPRDERRETANTTVLWTGWLGTL